MNCNKLIATLLRSENAKALLKKRYAFSETFYASKHSSNTTSKKDKKLDDLLDEPIKFSTSKAATWPAGATSDKIWDRPSYQGEVIMLSLAIFLLYFTVFREENDIDQKMVENIPIEIQEQIYGKKVNK